jgi:hypothetical protein
MCFNQLVLQCIVGSTLEESGIKVIIARNSNERVAVFRLDSNEFRVAFDLVGKNVCDGLVFYCAGGSRYLIFVELKSTDNKGSENQILVPFLKMRDRFLAIDKHFKFRGLVAT